MKNLFYILSGIILISASCKKGDEDPALSLLSRKARLTGTWKMVSLNQTHDYSSSQTVIEGDENQIVYTQTYTNGPEFVTTSTINNYSIEFNKDGSWKSIENVDVMKVKYFDGGTTTTTYSKVGQESGKWSFLRKIKGEFKNKERLVLDVLESENSVSEAIEIVKYDSSNMPNDTTYTAANELQFVKEYGNESRIIELLRLANNEMIWVLDDGYEYVNQSNASDGYSYERTGKIRWAKNE